MMPIHFRITANKQSGLSLIELMVALALSMVVSIAVFSTLISSQKQTKQTTSVNSRNQAGAFATHQLDLMIHNAGTGLSDYTNVMTSIGVDPSGCLLHVGRNSQDLLPNTGFLTPFNTLSGQIRLAPMLIQHGAANQSDILLLMSTGGVLSSLPSDYVATPTTSTLSVDTLLNYRANDLVLMVGTSLQPCILTQVQSSFVASDTSNSLPLSGEFAKSIIAGVSADSAQEYALNLGQTPKFLLLGVSEADHHLYQYDLLQPANNTVTNANPNLFIENVYRLKAIYGVDANGDGDLSDLTWVEPTGTYAYANINNNPALIRRIKAVKVSLVMRADERDPKEVSNNNLTIFEGTTVSQTVNINDQHYRYRAFEITVPIRNSML